MLRALSRRLLALLPLVVLVMSLGRGLEFLWCPGMQQVVASCCCNTKKEPTPGPAVERKGCCEAKAVPEGAPAVSNDTVSFAAPAALAEAIVPAPIPAPARLAATESEADAKVRLCTFARAGPRAPIPILHCSLLI